MSVSIEWNPNWERDLKREVIQNLTPKYRAALARVTCPDHREHPTLDPMAEEWRIRGCCEVATEMGLKAIAKVS